LQSQVNLGLVVPFLHWKTFFQLERGGILHWDLEFFAMGTPKARFCSISSALVMALANRLACLVKLLMRLIKDKTKARKINNPKLNNKLRSTTHIK
jgi:hypothetical protein